MYQNLRQEGLGGFAPSDFYWSSSVYDENSAYRQYFTTGPQSVGSKNIERTVRAVRAF